MLRNGIDCSDPVRCGHDVNVVQTREQLFTNSELASELLRLLRADQRKEEGHQSISQFATYPLPDTV